MRTVFSIVFLVFLLALPGCVAPTGDVASGQKKPESLTVPGPDAWNAAAERCVSSLIESGALKKENGGRPVVAVGTIADTTWWTVDETLLSHCLRLALLHSGKALSTSLPGKGETSSSAIQPDFKLDGTVEVRHRDSGGQPITPVFVVHLKLTDMETKLVPWEDVVPVDEGK